MDKCESVYIFMWEYIFKYMYMYMWEKEKESVYVKEKDNVWFLTMQPVYTMIFKNFYLFIYIANYGNIIFF